MQSIHYAFPLNHLDKSVQRRRVLRDLDPHPNKFLTMLALRHWSKGEELAPQIVYLPEGLQALAKSRI